MRYFRAPLAVYESVCNEMDAAYGYPSHETKTQRALPPVSELAADSQGRVYLAISESECAYAVPAVLLPQLLGSGAIEEIDTATYAALLPTLPA